MTIWIAVLTNFGANVYLGLPLSIDLVILFLNVEYCVSTIFAECPADSGTVSGGCTTFHHHKLGQGVSKVVA